MKKTILFVMLSFAFSMQMSAEEDIEKYRIPNYNSVEEYQYLVGKHVAYYPHQGKYHLLETTFDWGEKIKHFIVKSITGKTNKKRMWQETLWELQPVGTDNIIELKVFIGDYDKYISPLSNNTINMKNLYLMLFDQWKSDNQSAIGKVFTHPLVKAQYKVVDIDLAVGRDENYSEKVLLFYELENSVSGEKRKFSSIEAEKECFKEDLKGSYYSTLSKVEKPSNPAVKFGKTTTIKDTDKGITKYSYVDNFIDIVIFGDDGEFSFNLKNVSQNTEKLIWDEAVIVGISGETSKVMHNGIKYSEREASQPPSTIIKGASLNDIACPTANVFYSEFTHSWSRATMFPLSVSNETKQIRLMLPIQIKDVVNEYIFVFDVKYKYDHPERLNL